MKTNVNLELQKNGEYKEKKSSSGMIKIYFRNKPVSSRRTLGATYEDDFTKSFNGITFELFVEKHKNWMKNS